MTIGKILLSCATLATVMGCTQSVPSQFKLLPAEQSKDAGSIVSDDVSETQILPVDILWVIDNSASMAGSQIKLKNGLSAFADTYLKSRIVEKKSITPDIQMAVITTDLFLANELWDKYLNTPISSNSKFTPKTYFTKNINGEIVKRPHPEWGSDYAKLKSSRLLSTRESNLKSLKLEFAKQVAVGTDGIYEEHGFDSVEQFLNDNEKLPSSKNKLFRKGSQRIIVFLSDENDQSMDASSVGPEPRKLLFAGSYYKDKDPAAANKTLPAHFTIECPTSVVEGKTLEAMNICLRPGLVTPVELVKNRMDDFFRGLDGVPGANPNYSVFAIVTKDLNTIEKLRAVGEEFDSQGKKVITHERADRYLELVNLVGGASASMDIGSENYAPVLEKIGLEVVNHSTVQMYKQQTTFELDKAPDQREFLVVTLVRASGERIILKRNQFAVTGKILKITDEALIKTLKDGDGFKFYYQPSTVL